MMKKLLAVLFFCCVSLSLVGMDEEPTIMGKEQRIPKNNNLRMKSDSPYVIFKDPQLFLITPDEKKPFVQRIHESIVSHTISGLGQRGANLILDPFDALVIAPAVSNIVHWWYKDQLEQAELIQAQQKYMATIAKNSKELYSNVNKTRALLKHLESDIQERGLDINVLKKMKQEQKNLIDEFTKDVAPGFEKRAQMEQLTPQEIEKMNIFVKKQEELMQKYAINDAEDLKLLMVYHQTKEQNTNNMIEALELMNQQNEFSRIKRENRQKTITELEHAFMQKEQEKQRKEELQARKKEEIRKKRLQEDLEYEEKKRLQEEQWARDKEEWTIKKSNEEYFWDRGQRD